MDTGKEGRNTKSVGDIFKGVCAGGSTLGEEMLVTPSCIIQALGGGGVYALAWNNSITTVEWFKWRD